MEQQNNQQNLNNPPLEEKSYQDNSNVYNNKNNKDEILQLKKEIASLKSEQNNNNEKINKITQNFQNEIDKLKLQINDLMKEINELKNKKNKNKHEENINNINNINNENNENYDNYNNDSDDNMDNNINYSVQCLSKNLNIDIDQGDDRATIDIVIRNNSNNKYPINSYLICDNKNSLLLCEKVQLNELEPNQQQKVTILFKNLKCISKGKYRSIIKLQINNKVYDNSFFEIIVNVVDNLQNRNPQADNFQANFFYPKDIMPGGNFGNVSFGPNLNMNNVNMNNMNNDIKEIIANFKATFNLYDNDFYSDEKIEEALKKNDLDFNKAFSSLFD